MVAPGIIRYIWIFLICFAHYKVYKVQRREEKKKRNGKSNSKYIIQEIDFDVRPRAPAVTGLQT